MSLTEVKISDFLRLRLLKSASYLLHLQRCQNINYLLFVFVNNEITQ